MKIKTKDPKRAERIFEFLRSTADYNWINKKEIEKFKAENAKGKKHYA